MGKEELAALYYTILGRKPGDGDLAPFQNAKTPGETLRALIERGEFFKRPLFHITTSVLEKRRVRSPRLKVQVDVSADQLSRLFARTERTWDTLGKEEPHWSVMTSPQFKADTIATTVESFYASGQVEVDTFLATLARSGIEKQRLKRLTEIGCGVGRMTEHFCKHFAHVTAVDISQPHLDIAKQRLAAKGIKNVDFVKVERPSDYDRFSGHDCIYSFFTFQHNTPPVSKYLIGQLLAHANDAAVAYLQIPSYIEGYSFAADAYLSRENTGMEMHCLPQQDVLRCLIANKFDPVEIQQHALSDYRFTSYRYLATRSRAL